MGEDDGGLLSKPLLGWTSIKDIIHRYKVIHESDLYVLNEPFLNFLIEEIACELSFDLSSNAPFKIIETEWVESFRIVAENFEKLLF